MKPDPARDIVIEIHGDYQYEPSLADLMVEYIARGHYDVIQGIPSHSMPE